MRRLLEISKRLLANAIPLDVAGREALLSDAFFARSDDPRKSLIITGPVEQLASLWTEALYHHPCIQGPDQHSGQARMDDPELFDCFLSHNSADKPRVRALAEDLRARGISVWLDEEHLRPGVPWQPLLEAGIRASRSVAVLVGRDGLGPWESEEMRAALSLAVRDGRPVIPVLLADAPIVPDLPLFLAERTWVDLRPGGQVGNNAEIDRLIWGITGSHPARVPHDVTSAVFDRNDDRGRIRGQSALAILLRVAYVFRARRLPEGIRQADFDQLLLELDEIACT